METLLKSLPSVKTLFSVCIFAAIIIFGFKESILEMAKIGSDDFTLFLFFLILVLILTTGIAGYYAIAKKEIEAETEEKRLTHELANKKLDLQADKKNVATVTGSKRTKVKQKGAGGFADVTNSEYTEIEQDGNETPDDDAKKKA